MKQNDTYFMQLALELARKGLGYVSPNPMVGCVIVHEGKIIGEGYHEKYGQLHAEPNAVNSVENKGLIKESTVYVTLEPCAHFGKTPPCADLLSALKPKRVVICNDDPNPLVAGKGIEKLRNAGIEVEVGLLAEKGRELNKRFFTFQEKKRPYIILKWAQTADGFIARENYDSKWISNEASRKLVHQWRAEEAGIMVGTATAMYDNPQLNVRHVIGNNPVRMVIDRELKIPTHFHLFDQSQPSIIYNQVEARADNHNHFVQLDFSKNIVPQLLNDLFERKVLSVIVEGGAQLLQSFIDQGIWDEARVFESQTVFFGKGITAPLLGDATLLDTQTLEGDELRCFVPVF